VTDGHDHREQRHRDPTEGVRLLGSDEAAEALGREDIRRRFSEDQPRFGDRPAGPPADGPRPSLRFPLGSGDDPNAIERPPVVPVQRPDEVPELSHWSGTAAEEVPHMSGRDPRQGDESWPGYDPGPSWRDERPPQPPGAPWPDPASGGGAPGAPGTYGESGPAPGRSVFAGAPPAAGSDPGYDQSYEDTYGEEYEEGYAEAYDDVYDDEVYDEPPTSFPPPQRRGGPRTGAHRPDRRAPDRDLRTAVIVGVAFLGVSLALFKVLGPLGGLIVAVPVIAYATYEFFVAVNTAGFEAPMPVGVAAAGGAAIAAYNYGEAALPLVLVLATAVCFLWYLVGAGGDRPVANIGVTALGICWVGLFGSFAGLLLADPFGNGIALLLAAVIPTIGYDVGALFVGRSTGSRPLSVASPNKTIEGLAGGMLLAIVAAVVLSVVGVHPIDEWQEGLKIGVLVALVAPLGDLAESLVKRDLGIKDMGSVLPGHGGLLDRFDALLFVLPAIWYLARVSDFFVV
jgi:CDP-diglyceride synthetase